MAEDLKWTCDEFQKLPLETVTVDVHCVTKWSKLDTVQARISIVPVLVRSEYYRLLDGAVL
jgi:DMSO/TMAO reductase YedYZ molybdopterin-dependent catalytic subunit